MSRRIKKRNDWTKLVIVLSLLCSVFGVGVNAQTSDKPLNAQQLANLKTGLKQVVQENLAVAETDGKKYAAVTQKWDARKDLAGKSKTQVIDLLFLDVKSVVTDSGMQYQISQVFSLYKQMPDDQFAGQTKSKMGSDSKPEAVEQLTNLTFPNHPYVGIEAETAKLPSKVLPTKNISQWVDDTKEIAEQQKAHEAEAKEAMKNWDKIIETAKSGAGDFREAAKLNSDQAYKGYYEALAISLDNDSEKGTTTKSLYQGFLDSKDWDSFIEKGSAFKTKMQDLQKQYDDNSAQITKLEAALPNAKK